MKPKFLLTMVAVPALVVPKNAVEPPSFVIEVTPDMLALTITNWPSLVMSPMIEAMWLASPSCSVAQEQMVVPPL